eukprot:GHVT01023377.1.p1 GENE.GHVT01023377.1~~GHVT01023377.1.p1  ORF type:complete len:301 (+),score=39.52 GHVT01023377.1:2128-3030(+)
MDLIAAPPSLAHAQLLGGADAPHWCRCPCEPCAVLEQLRAINLSPTHSFPSQCAIRTGAATTSSGGSHPFIPSSHSPGDGGSPYSLPLHPLLRPSFPVLPQAATATPSASTSPQDDPIAVPFPPLSPALILLAVSPARGCTAMCLADLLGRVGAVPLLWSLPRSPWRLGLLWFLRCLAPPSLAVPLAALPLARLLLDFLTRLMSWPLGGRHFAVGASSPRWRNVSSWTQLLHCYPRRPRIGCSLAKTAWQCTKFRRLVWAIPRRIACWTRESGEEAARDPAGPLHQLKVLPPLCRHTPRA